MHRSTRSHTRFGSTAVAGISLFSAAAMPLAVANHTDLVPTITQNARLAAAEVPIGGLIGSFVHNQAVYCSIICPLLVETGVVATATTIEAPATFLAALRSGDVLKAIGITAASVTGPTNAAAAAAILADGSEVAPRAQNAFEVAVVGLLDVGSATPGGLSAVIEAAQVARQETFDALNAPIVPNPPPTVTADGLVQVAAVGAMNVVGAIIFPAFNEVLGAGFAVPDAFAQELAVSGDPARAFAAAATSAARSANAAAAVVEQAISKAVNDIRVAGGQSSVVGSSTLSAENSGNLTQSTGTQPALRSGNSPELRAVGKTSHSHRAVRIGPATVGHALDR